MSDLTSLLVSLPTEPRPGTPPKLTLSELERLAKNREAFRSLPQPVRDRIEREVIAGRIRLRAVSCSDAWFAECWEKGTAYPPRADTTPMLPCACYRCASSGRLWPAHYLTDVRAEDGGGVRRVSYECGLETLGDWQAAQLPSSPSGLALRAIREGRIKLRRRRTRLGGGGRPRG